MFGWNIRYYSTFNHSAVYERWSYNRDPYSLASSNWVITNIHFVHAMIHDMHSTKCPIRIALDNNFIQQENSAMKSAET